MSYLTPQDPGAFEGASKRIPEPGLKLTSECPKCQGYGGWHLRLNAYGPGKHFSCVCFNCHGWGYVRPEEAGHAHEFDRGVAVGRCLTQYTCQLPGCGYQKTVDSSD